ncbi:MAG: bifunctional riboflavin kinase/FAD synthetase, partial [Burkholderiaceae bacterium]|nr:bifunctional riboflavin kinase/FAD synthetase [Burkholderiaceae bacterium]
AAAAQRGLVPTVLTFSPHSREYLAVRARKPNEAPTVITTLREKLSALSRAGAARVILLRFNDALAEMTSSDFIRTILAEGLRTKWLTVGEHFRFGRQAEGTTQQLISAGAQYGFHVDVMPPFLFRGKRISSSDIREALKQGDFARAGELLGKPYVVSGHVIPGDKRGRRLGFPTANLSIPSFNPVFSGVYVSRVHGLNAVPLPAVSMIGHRLTVDAVPSVRLETHILDYDDSCYGRLIRIEFLKKIRENRQFPDLAALKESIRQDVLVARHFLVQPDGD